MPGNQFNGIGCKTSHNVNNKHSQSSNGTDSRHQNRCDMPNAASSSSSSSYNNHKRSTEQQGTANTANPLSDELRAAIQHMVANISKSFIVEWYTSISPTNHDFVASCESLINEVLLKLAELIIEKLDKYKLGQLVTTLLHDHVLNESHPDKRQSIEHQIQNYEYDICQSSVVRLFGLLSNENLRRVVFTIISDTRTKIKNDLNSRANTLGIHRQHYQNNQYQQQRFSTRAPNAYPKSFSFEDIILSASAETTPSSQSDLRSKNLLETPIKTTSALYTLVIAMLTKAAFMPIISNISDPKWLYAVIIWLCKKEEREKAKLEELLKRGAATTTTSSSETKNRSSVNRPFGSGPHPANILSSTSIIVTGTKGSRAVDLEDGFDIASANINFNNPICGSLKRPLDNIEIFATEEVKGNNSCYVLYCIRYDGLCYRHPSASGFTFIPDQPEVPIIDKRQTHSVRRRNETNIRTSHMTTTTTPDEQDVSNRKSFRRSMTIKRRFREFVLLQLRLEENPKIRPYMKHIPKPTKLKAATQNIFSLPGINNIKLDQSTIKLRQRFLERFLIALNSSPFIANSYEFKEFFSYNINPSGTSKSKSTILQVNLNKVFVDSVRSAFSIIRSTLPGDDYQSLNSSSKANPDAWLTELQQSTLKLHVQTRTSHSKMNLERCIDSKLLSLGDSPTRNKKSSSLERQHQRGGAFDWMGGSRGGSLKANMDKTASLGSNTQSSSITLSRSSSNYSAGRRDSSTQSKSDSSESIYHDAGSSFEDDPNETNNAAGRPTECNSIQICDNYPIASRFIDIIHYSISRNASCSKSPFNLIARLFLGRFIERNAIQMIEAALTLKNAAFCINSITSSIWDESDDPPLDLERASLDEALIHLTRLVEQKYGSHTFVPRQLLRTLISKQLRFYLSQLESQERNKFVIYSFFVHLLDELEVNDDQ